MAALPELREPVPVEAKGRSLNPAVPVLMYHRIGRAPKNTIVPGHYVGPATLKNHLKLLRWMGYDFVDAEHALESPRGAMLTFDDAYLSVFELALPHLLAQKARATTFVVTDLIGKTSEWDVRKGDCPEPLMTAEHLKTWIEHGLAVGCHSATHPMLASLDEDQLEREIVHSRQQLFHSTGVLTDTFCYPYGNEDLRVRAAVQRAGYRFGFATTKGPWTSKTDPYQIPRINCRRDTWTPILLLKLRRIQSSG